MSFLNGFLDESLTIYSDRIRTLLSKNTETRELSRYVYKWKKIKGCNTKKRLS